MKYPQFLERFNRILGNIAGGLIIVIALFSALEGILRGIFSSPTTWTLNISQYILIWAVFLGTAYAFQEKNHVVVDFVREAAGRRWGFGIQKILAILSYLIALVFVVVILWNSIELLVDALKLNILTLGTIQIPASYLYMAMLVGSLAMLITIVCIVLDLFSGSKKYL